MQDGLQSRASGLKDQLLEQGQQIRTELSQRRAELTAELEVRAKVLDRKLKDFLLTLPRRSGHPGCCGCRRFMHAKLPGEDYEATFSEEVFNVLSAAVGVMFAVPTLVKVGRKGFVSME